MKKDYKKIKNLKATTLIEVLIASVISAISFSIGLMMYINILHSSHSILKSKLSLFIDQEIYETINSKNFSSETLELENIEIQKEVSNYKRENDIVLITYRAIDIKGKTIVEKNIIKHIGN